MVRILLGCAVLAGIALPCGAQQTVSSNETLIRLQLQPMPAPKPALRYLLLPELREMNPGNPIPNYLKCLMDQDFAADQEALGRFALRHADYAARLDKPDWQILLKLKTDGISLLLPDVQKIRTLAFALRERFHEEVVQHRFDDAIRTAKTMFAMSRHMGEHPTLIGDLVGIAIAFNAIEPLQEMLEQPGSPNLYWALTHLPSPLISLDKGMEGERALMGSELRDLDETAPMSPAQLKKLIAHIEKLLAFEDASRKLEGGVRKWLDDRTKNKEMVRAARSRLIEVGLSEERLLRFPADQVILLDEKRELEVRRDEIMKFLNLPLWEIEAIGTWTKKTQTRCLFDLFVPSIHKVRRAQARLEQRVALLRHVEALRIYAAEHGGKLPAKLAEVTVPLPNDPVTGKAFRYNLDGATAHLRGTPPPGEENNAGYNVHYELTVQK